jgi:ankyrin repeat protein
VNAKNSAQNTPLHEAVWTVPGDPRPEMKLACARLLIAAGADVNACNGKGSAALHVASRQANVDLVPIL